MVPSRTVAHDPARVRWIHGKPVLIDPRADETLPVDPDVDPLAPGNYHRLARRSGLAVSTISRVLTGQRGCSFYIAAHIAKTARVSLDRLWKHVNFMSEGRNLGRRTRHEIARRRRAAHARELSKATRKFTDGAFAVTPLVDLGDNGNGR